MNERDRRARREPHRTGGGARPFAPGEAPLGVTGIGAGLTYSQLDFIGPVPAGAQEYVYMAAGVSVNSKAGEAARALVKYLADPVVVKLMNAKGLEPPAK